MLFVTARLRTVDCPFTDKFSCGYFRSKDRKDLPDWIRHKGPGFSSSTSPKAASSGSALGINIGERPIIVSICIDRNVLLWILVAEHSKIFKLVTYNLFYRLLYAV